MLKRSILFAARRSPDIKILYRNRKSRSLKDKNAIFNSFDVAVIIVQIYQCRRTKPESGEFEKS
jgi:hypothetical protein